MITPYLVGLGFDAVVVLVFALAAIVSYLDTNDYWQVPHVGIDWFGVETDHQDWHWGAVLGALAFVFVWGVVIGAGINGLMT